MLLPSIQIKVCVCLTSQKRRQVPINTHFLQVLAVFGWSSWFVYWERLGTWQYRLQIYPCPPEKGRSEELQPWRYGLLRVFPLLYLTVWMESWVLKNYLVQVFSQGSSDLSLLLILQTCTQEVLVIFPFCCCRSGDLPAVSYLRTMGYGLLSYRQQGWCWLVSSLTLLSCSMSDPCTIIQLCSRVRMSITVLILHWCQDSQITSKAVC